MGKIFCLIGPSASGKDTIYKSLINRMNLERNVMYTTRPKRDLEEDGVEYFFVSENIYNEMKDNGNVVEARTYSTKYGDWTYFTSSSSFDLDHNDYLVVNTLEGFKNLKNYYGEDVIPLHIYVNSGLRLERAFAREKMESMPKYEEMCRRFLADQKDFSNGNLRACGIDSSNTFINDDLNNCIDSIVSYLEQYGITRSYKALYKKDGN